MVFRNPISINSIESNDTTVLPNAVKEAISMFDHTIGHIQSVYTTRWQNLRQRLSSKLMMSTEHDEVLKTMMDDPESRKFVKQRLSEILQNVWATEREELIL